MAKQGPKTAVIFRAESVLLDYGGKMIPNAIRTVGDASRLVDALGLVVTWPKTVIDPWLLAQFDSVQVGEPIRTKLRRSSTDQPLQLYGLFQSAMSELGVGPDATTVVEANPSGIEIAKSLGCFVIGVQKEGHQCAGADVVITESNGHTLEAINDQLAKRITGHE